MSAVVTPGSFDSDTPSYSDDPAAMSQSSITSSISSAAQGDEEPVMSTPKRYHADLSYGSAPQGQPRPNSSQYETMEELLAAAGYSETRVFTPEGESMKRLIQDQENGGGYGSQRTTAGSGIGRLVTGLIAHIIPTGVGVGVGTSEGSVREQKPELRIQLVEGRQSNPFLESSPSTGIAGCAYPQAAQSLRTHLLSTHTIVRSSSRSAVHHRAQPALRHTTSAPSLPRISTGRRRALPSLWRDTGASNPAFKAWSGGFVPKMAETQLKPHSGTDWFESVNYDARSQPSPTGTIRPRTNVLRATTPALHRARSAPRSTYIHVPLPAPPMRPSPVLQQNTVVCRSQPVPSPSLSVRIQSSSKSRTRGVDNDDQPSPILAPEPGLTLADGLPPTPARPVLCRARSSELLRRTSDLIPAEDEPDLAAIVHTFRPSYQTSAPSSPACRQGSIRSLRALLKDPRLPDVPIVYLASPRTVGAGGPGRALWMDGAEWEAEVGRKNVFGRGENDQ